MSNYKHIIFDLDHTLWDFDTNCTETILELFPLYKLDKYVEVESEKFIEAYKKVNHSLWNDYHKGLISKETLRSNRFEKTLAMFGIQDQDLSMQLNDAFIKICPTKKNLLPYTFEILEYLKPKYELHILTNGFKESQYTKMNSSGIAGFFVNVFNSESTGFLKPNKKFFDYAISTINTTHQDCIMIGDDLEADILGAKNAGIDHVFYNRSGELHSEKITFEIRCLSEIKNIL